MEATMKTTGVAEHASRTLERSASRGSAEPKAIAHQRVLLAAGILSAVIYVAADIVAARLYPGYSYNDQAVSELFAIGAPTSRFVVTFFTLSSALMFPFALGVWYAAGRSRLQRAIAVMFAGAAVVGLLLWNFFPMHVRGVERTMTDTMHLALATNPFVPASYVLAAIAFRGRFRVYTLATILVILALASYGFSFAPAITINAPTPWMGLSERAGQYVGALWQSVLAVMLIRRASPAS
jgi:hypothetical protein